MRRPWLCGLLGLLFLLPGCQAAQEQADTPMGVAYTAADGTELFRWAREHFGDFYRLEDGTELLWDRTPSWPWNTFVVGLEGFDGMTQEAQAAVRTYYEDRGLLYDVEEQLVIAYKDYLAFGQAQGAQFRSRMVEQSVYPAYETETITIFGTSMMFTTPGANNGMATEEKSQVIFDRTTGAVMDVWSLFTVPPEEAVDDLLALCADWDLPPQEELRSALIPENIFFESGGLSLNYPAGSLNTAGYEGGTGFGFDYEDVADILQPWAMPPEAKT